MPFPLSHPYQDALLAAEALPPTIKTIDRLASEFGQEAAAWAVGQQTLREKGRTKFANADQMIFTREGLEMTAHEKVAAFHASLFEPGTAVTDGTCGIGGDLIALAARGPANGFDLNQAALECAEWNLTVQGHVANLIQGSVMEADWAGRNLWLDPARRSGSGRTLNPDSFQPTLTEILQKAKSAENCWIKLTPLLSDEILESQNQGLIFVSHKGECVEALMQAGGKATEKFRRAYRVDEGIFIEAGGRPASAEEPGDWVYEADPAAIRAHCLGSFGLQALGGTPGWLTGEDIGPNPWLTQFRVHWQGAWREESVREALKQQEASLDAVKTRGVAIEPSTLLKKLRKGLPEGGLSLELLLYQKGPKIRALLAQRIKKLPGG